MDKLKLKNIWEKSKKLIDYLKLNNEVDITLCCLNECKSIFYFVVETKKLEYFIFSLDEKRHFLSGFFSAEKSVFLKTYDDLENSIICFLKNML